MLAALGTACLFAASPAMAEVSSVDAYGGQAAVLGQPRHRFQGPTHGVGRESGGGTGGGSVGRGSAGAGGVGGGSGSGGPPRSPHSGSTISGSGSSGSRGAGARAAEGGHGAALADSASGGLSLSAIDWLLLIALLAVLLATAASMRRIGRSVS
jgi:hypothetical protein